MNTTSVYDLPATMSASPTAATSASFARNTGASTLGKMVPIQFWERCRRKVRRELEMSNAESTWHDTHDDDGVNKNSAATVVVKRHHQLFQSARAWASAGGLEPTLDVHVDDGQPMLPPIAR